MFVKQKSDLIIYIAGIAGFALISNLSLWTRLRQYVDRPQKENIRPLKKYKASCFLIYSNDCNSSIYCFG